MRWRRMATAAAEVTWEDQKRINLFGRLNGRKYEVAGEIKGLTELQENLADASDEAMIADDDEMCYVMGEGFAVIGSEEVGQRLEEFQAKNEAKLEKLTEEKEAIETKMAELKTLLYAKFKGSINLED